MILWRWLRVLAGLLAVSIFVGLPYPGAFASDDDDEILLKRSSVGSLLSNRNKAEGARVAAPSDPPPAVTPAEHGENGFLCDFWDHDMLADMTTELLARSDAMGPVRAAARQSIVEEYNLKVQIPRHMDLLLSTYADWKKARQTS